MSIPVERIICAMRHLFLGNGYNGSLRGQECFFSIHNPSRGEEASSRVILALGEPMSGGSRV